MAEPQQWKLDSFLECLDAWVELERPPSELRVLVTMWIFTRQADPYQGVQREPGFPNLWHGRIPRAVHPPGRVVVCSYFISEAERIVKCTSFGSLPF